MMKIAEIIFTVLLMCLFCGCMDQSYRGYEEDFSTYSPSLTVQVAVGDPSNTKGTGPVDNLLNFKGKDVHVWAFSRDSLADYRITRAQDSLTCLVDGFPAMLDGSNSIAKWRNGSRFYYPRFEYSTVKYDFFAAYLDGAEFKVRRQTDQIDIDFVIDGSQDVLLSKAKLPIDKKGVTKEYAFSYLSASEGDIPVFTLHHQLVRVDLVVRPGISTGNTSRVIISKATLRSRTDAVMTVAAKDSSKLGTLFKENSPYADLLLTEDGGGELRLDTLSIIKGDPLADSAQFLQKERTHRVGAGFFVSPENSYILSVRLHEPDHDENYVDREPIDNLVRLSSGGDFLQGNHYVVTMTVFGERDIYYNVSLKPWSNAGSFIIDHDADSECIELMISASDIKMHAGETCAINPKILPKDRKDVSYSFESMDTGVATVTEAGEVHGVSPGNTYVTIRASRNAVGDLNAGTGVKIIKVEVINE